MRLESRLQRFEIRNTRSWGDAPGWYDAAPLALGAPAARKASRWMFSFEYSSMMRLTKKIKVRWLIVIVAVAGALLLFFATRSDEPTHGGRRLSYWIRRHYTSDEKARLEAETAIRAMGTNAIPHLIRMLPERDAAWKIAYDSKIIQLFDYDWSKAQTFLLGSRSHLAARALGTIGPPAREAIPFLIANMTNAPLSSSSPSEYVIALLAIGADSVLPLANALSHPNPDLRNHAAWALGNLDSSISHGDTRIPSALLQSLKDEDEEVRYRAADSLGNLGAEAKVVLPALIECLNDKDTNFQAIVRRVISEIDTDLTVEGNQVQRKRN